MIASLAGWQRRTVDKGALLVASDPQVGTIRVHVGVPLRPLRQVVADLTRNGFMGAAFAPATPPKLLTTAESEYAALFELVARPPQHAGEVRRAIAMVIGDRDLVAIDGHAVRPEGHDIGKKVESLALGFALGLGTDRWRRPFYLAPAGWNRLARFHADIWVAPDYPANAGIITVLHARLKEGAADAPYARLFEHLPAEYGRAEPLARGPVASASGLQGESRSYAADLGGTVRRATHVTLADARVLYQARLETDVEHAAANAEVFDRLVISMESLPTPQATAAPFEQWSE